MKNTFLEIRSLDQSKKTLTVNVNGISTKSITYMYLLQRYWIMAFIYSVRKEPVSKS